jgi:hypothetical protein
VLVEKFRKISADLKERKKKDGNGAALSRVAGLLTVVRQYCYRAAALAASSAPSSAAGADLAAGREAEEAEEAATAAAHGDERTSVDASCSVGDCAGAMAVAVDAADELDPAFVDDDDDKDDDDADDDKTAGAVCDASASAGGVMPLSDNATGELRGCGGGLESNVPRLNAARSSRLMVLLLLLGELITRLNAPPPRVPIAAAAGLEAEFGPPASADGGPLLLLPLPLAPVMASKGRASGRAGKDGFPPEPVATGAVDDLTPTLCVL